jgi:hypothetical protein
MKRQHRLHSKGGCCSGSAVKRLALNGCSQPKAVIYPVNRVQQLDTFISQVSKFLMIKLSLFGNQTSEKPLTANCSGHLCTVQTTNWLLAAIHLQVSNSC